MTEEPNDEYQERAGRLSQESKAPIIQSVRPARLRTEKPLRQILGALGISPARFYRWLREPSEPASKERAARPTAPAPTPPEEQAVRR